MKGGGYKLLICSSNERMASSSIELKPKAGMKLLASNFGFFMDASVDEPYTDNQFIRILKKERVGIDTTLTCSFGRF